MFINKIILFWETLEYYNAINLCYGKREIQKLQGHVLDAHTWAICRVVVETLFLVVKQCIFLYQTQGYWLFIGVVNVTLSINVCMKN
jgi:hypothetical protein